MKTFWKFNYITAAPVLHLQENQVLFLKQLIRQSSVIALTQYRGALHSPNIGKPKTRNHDMRLLLRDTDHKRDNSKIQLGLTTITFFFTFLIAVGDTCHVLLPKTVRTCRAIHCNKTTKYPFRSLWMVFFLQAVITLNKHVDLKHDTNLIHWNQENCVSRNP